MQDDLLSEGLTLMALGVGFVFVFLTLLVLITSLMSWVIRRYFPQPQRESHVQAQPRADADLATSSPMEDTTLMAVIGAAVHRHRKHRR